MSWLTDDKVVVPALTALAVVFVNWLMQHGKDRNARHADRVAEQIEKLYGPLYFYTGRNAELLKRHANVSGLYKAVYEGKNWSEGSLQHIEKECTTTIAVMNRYTQMITGNNGRMVRIITKYYPLMDSGDRERLQEFVTDWNRRELEMGLPSRVVGQSEPIAFYRQEFADCIAARFEKLLRQWRNLSRPIWDNVARKLGFLPRE